MVAAAGGEGALSPARAWTALGAFLLLLVAMMLISPASTDLGLAPMEKSPDVLRDRAREIVRGFGYTERPADEATWLRRDYSPIRWLADHTVSTEWRRRLREMGAPVLLLYRRSASPLVPLGPPGRVTETDPAPDPGDILVVVDADGRLRELSMTPARWSSPAPDRGTSPTPDSAAFPEAAVFQEMGLDRARFTPVDPERLPPAPFDERREWTGTRAEAPDIELRLSAATFEGRLVSASLLGPWSARGAKDPLTSSMSAKISRWSIAVMVMLVTVAGVIFARRNIRLGRGDRRGAFRVAVAGFLLALAGFVVSGHLVREWADFLESQVFPAIGESVLAGGYLWLVYMSLEPYLRRRMPNLLVGWARVLDGRFRDPRVGRDVLYGLVLGAFLATVYHLVNGLPTWIPFTGQTTIPLFNVRDAARMVPLAAPFGAANDAFVRTLASTMILFVLRLFTSRSWIAVVVLTIVFTAFALGGENPVLETPGALITGLVIALTLVRLGPLGAGVMWFASIFLVTTPVRTSLSLWYAPYMLATLALVLGLAAWSFRTALGGRSAIGSVSLDA